MPQVIFTPAAVLDLKILRGLLKEKGTRPVDSAAKILTAKITQLSMNAKLGRPVELPDGTLARELGLSLSGEECAALYAQDGELVVVLLVRSKEEIGYCP